jgi:hypothetical protein
MRSLNVLCAIALLCLAVPLRAENIFHPIFRHKKEILVVTLHMTDAVMTHQALSNPCQCYREGNPLAPSSGSWGAQIGFHAGLSALAIGGAYWFRHHNAPKSASFLLWESIAMESVAVTSDTITSEKH